ncbi:hypothetical protein B0H10DRAFT_1677554, partial [Mycena sp. CBHHK59/15]
IMQMVNSLSSKLQLGSPMACLFLLGNPDHYTNLKFKVCWWRGYVNEVNKSWPSEPTSVDHVSGSQEVSPEEAGNLDASDRVLLTKSADGFVGSSHVDDYTYRPPVMESVCLYDYIQMSERK